MINSVRTVGYILPSSFLWLMRKHNICINLFSKVLSICSMDIKVKLLDKKEHAQSKRLILVQVNFLSYIFFLVCKLFGLLICYKLIWNFQYAIGHCFRRFNFLSNLFRNRDKKISHLSLFFFCVSLMDYLNSHRRQFAIWRKFWPNYEWSIKYLPTKCCW